MPLAEAQKKTAEESLDLQKERLDIARQTQSPAAGENPLYAISQHLAANVIALHNIESMTNDANQQRGEDSSLAREQIVAFASGPITSLPSG